ncbi:MAG: nicotinate (nicotinamide) nucleotide adenylyltransferase [Verrucomicrobiae bacterium]|nr:nicotinate (nicotinamide) nucleotide adenylyltransferase [Verrucomicrobiae bacterium]
MIPARRIGLYGGSFDPVHLGHLLVAQSAVEELALDRLVLIPAAQSPFKPGSQPAPGPLRTRLLRLAFAGFPRTEVDTQELDRGGISYSIDTARTWRDRFPEATLFWLIGEDHVAALPRWRDAPLLAQWLEFVVIPRPGAPPAPDLPPPFRLTRLRGFPLALSSSQIRTRTAAGQPIHHLVPPAVAEALLQERPYPPSNP